MRRIIHAVTTMFLVGIVLSAPALAGPPQVKLEGNQFEPRSIQVAPGAKVVWKDVEPDDRPHTVTTHAGQGESFESHPNCPPLCMGQGDTFEHTFNKVGTFTYYCEPHGDPNDPDCVGMCGKVVVRQPAAGPESGGATQTQAPAQTQGPATKTAPIQGTLTAVATLSATLSAEPISEPTATPTATVLGVQVTGDDGTGRGVLFGLAIAAVVLAGGGAFAWSRLWRVRA